METLQDYIDKLDNLNFREVYKNGFLLTWERTDEELETVWTAADVLCFMRGSSISTKVFKSGLSISLFRDNPTRTRFSFTSTCNLLGLEIQNLDEGKNQVAHDETARKTANITSFMADVIDVRDDMCIDKDNAYIHEVVDAIIQGHKGGTLEQRPTLVNLQCGIDHPTQYVADMLRIIHEPDGVENLKGKKLTMAQAYSPSYDKPLSVPQGVVGLTTRMGMEAVLAHPGGYEIIPEVEEAARKDAEKTDDSFRVLHNMAGTFKDADIVYPKSWAPFAAMEKRTNLYAEGGHESIKALEKELLARNTEHKD